MAEIEYLHVCDSAFMAEGGKHCIIGIFDVINAMNFPAAHPTLTLAIRLRGQAHELVPLKIDLARPNGEVLNSVPIEVTVGPDGSAFVNMNIVGSQFPEPGRYTFKLSSGSRVLGTHSLRLQKMQATPQAGPQQTPPKLH